MERNSFALIALVLAILGACASGQRGPADGGRVATEDVAVLRAAVDEECSGAPDYFVLSAEPLRENILDIEEGLPKEAVQAVAQVAMDLYGMPLDDARLRSLVARGRDQIVTVPALRHCQGIRMAGASVEDLYGTPHYRGRLRLSLPGYSADGTRAIVLKEWYLGPLGAESSLVELTKQEGVWHVVRKRQLWVA